MANISRTERVSNPGSGLIHAIIEDPEMIAEEEAIVDEVDDWAHRVLQQATRETLEHLEGFGPGINPPPVTDPDGAMRPAHPGGWSDITNSLVHSYDSEVVKREDGWEGAIVNTDPDARYLEGKDGLYVVSGVELPGGPLHEAVEEALKQVHAGKSVDTGKLADELLGNVTPASEG